MDLQICSKTLWFQVEKDADIQAIDNIIQTGQNPLTCCENLIRVGNNVLLYNRRKNMSFRHGMKTLQQTLQLTDVPCRIKPDRALPGYFFENFLASGTIDDERVVQLQGDISRCELQAIIVAAKAKSQNNAKVKQVLKKGTIQCVIDGHVPMNQLQNIKTAEQALKNDVIEKRCLRNDLEYDRTVSYTVRQTGKRVIIKSFKDPSLAITTEEHDPTEAMTIDNCCDDDMNEDNSVKKKHYYIYSHNPGYGKSKFSARLQRKWNACSVKDSNNFSGFRDNVQFIIFDEFSHDTKISFPDLKKLTGGNASEFGGNRKVFGDAFVPRADAQVIIFSNHHLFECIGKYNPRTTRRSVSFYMARQMVERFHIIKLDDEEETEFGDAVQHIDFLEQKASNRPFDVKFDSDGHPINKEGHLTSYSIACKYDTRKNKAFNAIKQSVLDDLFSFTVTNEKLFQTDLPKPQKESNNERKRIAMCVEDTLKRYIYLHRGNLDEFTVEDIEVYSKLKWFYNHQNELLVNERYMEYIYNNRYELYEEFGDEHLDWDDVQDLEKKWYHPDNHDKIRDALYKYSNIHHHGIERYFNCVMENIDNPKHAEIIKNMGADIKKRKELDEERQQERLKEKQLAEEQKQERLKQQQLAESSQENAMAMETV